MTSRVVMYSTFFIKIITDGANSQNPPVNETVVAIGLSRMFLLIHAQQIIKKLNRWEKWT